MKQDTQLSTLAGGYAIQALREDTPSLDVIEELELTHGLTPRDAESLVELAEAHLAQETGARR